LLTYGPCQGRMLARPAGFAGERDRSVGDLTRP
jgi:hypothetical protein